MMKYFLCFIAISIVTTAFPAKEKKDKKDKNDKAFELWQKNMENTRTRTDDRNHKKMILRIKEIERVCKLDEDQLKYLELAAKGAVEHASEAWMEYQEKMWRRRREGNNRGVVFKRELQDPTSQEVWTNAISESLTDGQQQAYRQELGARAMFYAETTIYRLIQQLDDKARMSADQRKLLKEQVHATLKIPLKDMDMQGVQTLVYGTFAKLPKEPLQEIFSPEQFKEWVSFSQRYGWANRNQGPKAIIREKVVIEKGAIKALPLKKIQVAPADNVEVNIQIKVEDGADIQNPAVLQKVEVRPKKVDEPKAVEQKAKDE